MAIYLSTLINRRQYRALYVTVLYGSISNIYYKLRFGTIIIVRVGVGRVPKGNNLYASKSGGGIVNRFNAQNHTVRAIYGYCYLYFAVSILPTTQPPPPICNTIRPPKRKISRWRL